MHNYGLAVDVSIVNENGEALPMGTEVDHLGIEAHITHEVELVKSGRISKEAYQNRLLLRQVMKDAGFRALNSEWWHFNRCSREEAKQRYKRIENIPTMTLSRQTLDFIRDHAHEDIHALALQTPKYPDVDMPAAILQIAGKQAAANKIPSWAAIEGILYPRHLSMEQCSSETTALYKASLLNGNTLTDLTGGLGIDCAFLATKFKHISYVERQEELCEIASHNFPLLGLNHITIYNEDAVTHLQQMNREDCIFIDPARRNEHGGKTVAISDCEPDVAKLEELLLSKANRIMIKLSPMLDLSLALKTMKHTQEAHVISVNNDCKELLLIIGDTPPHIRYRSIASISHPKKNRALFSPVKKKQERNALIQRK